MKLRIISNYSLTSQHLGTVDRDQPDVYYDYRGKAQGCHNAARSLPTSLHLTDGTQTTMLSIPDGVTIDHYDLAQDQILLTPQHYAALHKVHSPAHVEELSRISKSLSAGEVNQTFGREADVWIGTEQAATSALFAALTCVDDVAASPPHALRTYANVWPPGHHAEGVGSDGSSDIAMGFCYISNAAVAAFYARSVGFKTLVIDIDNHSGNGTRKALMNQKDLAVIDFVYVSPFDERRGGYLDGFWDPVTQRVIGVAREFPYRQNDLSRGIKAHPVFTASNILSLEFVGKEFGGGESPLQPAASHSEIVSRYANECLPWIRDFNPEMIIWSVGLDAAANDPLGALGFLPYTFFDIIRTTSRSVPEARMVGIMEGGYKAENWTECLWPVLFGFATL